MMNAQEQMTPPWPDVQPVNDVPEPMLDTVSLSEQVQADQRPLEDLQEFVPEFKRTAQPQFTEEKPRKSEPGIWSSLFTKSANTKAHAGRKPTHTAPAQAVRAEPRMTVARPVPNKSRRLVLLVALLGCAWGGYAITADRFPGMEGRIRTAISSAVSTVVAMAKTKLSGDSSGHPNAASVVAAVTVPEATAALPEEAGATVEPESSVDTGLAAPQIAASVLGQPTAAPVSDAPVSAASTPDPVTTLGEEAIPAAPIVTEPSPKASVIAPVPDTQDVRIKTLEEELQRLKDKLSTAPQEQPQPHPQTVKTTKFASHTAKRVLPRTPKPESEPREEVIEEAPRYNGRVLSVDMWDGKPSVMVITGDPTDKRTVVLQPGDSVNGVTLREASVKERSASFDVGNGRVIKLTAGEER
ncbi:hypothetical protein G7047_10710 [Diaphorobacter sp. HDW4A]|uniref:hypothetical protein n=1 Tax=Diaphorobacter sp. HDW4A TaxID=2714924 RepID=UPI001409EF83|nr:hypothetical protein [Diaphorobacter sp. HDW4A]QIL80322.1 hypothetical protein G7047_10710 [Diaphorobacter sp. HDW4A]